MDEIAEPLPRILVPIRLVSWHVKGPTRISIIRTMATLSYQLCGMTGYFVLTRGDLQRRE